MKRFVAVRVIEMPMQIDQMLDGIGAQRIMQRLDLDPEQRMKA